LVVVSRNRFERILQVKTEPARARLRPGASSFSVALVVALSALVLPAPASAAVPSGFTPCSSARGFYCGQVVVPVDRSGLGVPLTTTITLRVMWKAATVADSDGALFTLAGGPGQAATPYANDFAKALAPALKTRDLVVFDQRGTGANALDCASAARAATFQEYVRDCANDLGAARSYYTSKDSALDLDAVREAIGVDKATVYGVSYGTYVAQLYARLFPTHAAALVLDSVVSSSGVDPFLRSNFTAISSVLSANCANKLCRGITSSSYNDLKKLTALTRKKGALPLRYVNAHGEVRSATASQADLFYFMTEIYSLDAAARARFPAAVRAALDGDPYPLGRLFAPSSSGEVSNAELSETLYLATRCTEESFPWATTDATSIRRTKLSSALSGIAASTFNPFTSETALSLSDVGYCIYWPTPTVAVDPSVTAPLPDIPVLVLSGQEDDVTPAADGKAVAALFPHATILSVPYTGHSVTTDVWPTASNCVTRALTSFFSNTAVASCGNVTPFFRPVKRDPTSLDAVAPLKLKGIRGRTLAAVLGTLSDVTMTELSGSGPTAGLRGGYFSGSIVNLRLHKLVYVPGVIVNGRLSLTSGRAKLTISGQGARGKLVIHRYRKFTTIKGTLDQKRVSVKTRTSLNDATVVTRLPELLGLGLARRSLS
jgi:pimeloyl-ACP methyl ester carboxylesterase